MMCKVVNKYIPFKYLLCTDYAKNKLSLRALSSSACHVKFIISIKQTRGKMCKRKILHCDLFLQNLYKFPALFFTDSWQP